MNTKKRPYLRIYESVHLIIIVRMIRAANVNRPVLLVGGNE